MQFSFILKNYKGGILWLIPESCLFSKRSYDSFALPCDLYLSHKISYHFKQCPCHIISTQRHQFTLASAKNCEPQQTRSPQNRPSVLLCIESPKDHPVLWRILSNRNPVIQVPPHSSSYLQQAAWVPAVQDRKESREARWTNEFVACHAVPVQLQTQLGGITVGS